MALIVPNRKVWTRPPSGIIRPSRDYEDAAILWAAGQQGDNRGWLEPFVRQGFVDSELCLDGGAGLYSPNQGANNRFTGPTINPYTANWPGVTVVTRLKFKTQANNTYPGIVSWVPVGDYYGGFNLSVEYSGSYAFFNWRAGASTNGLTGTTYGATGSVEWAVGDNATVIATWDKSEVRLVIARDGKALVFNSHSHAYGWRNSDSLFSLLGYYRSGYRTIPHPVEMVTVLPRSIDTDQMVRFAENPWQGFRQTDNIIVTSAGSTTTHQVVGANSSQPNASNTSAVSQIHLVAGTNSSQSNTVIAGFVTQTHIIVGIDSRQLNTASAGAVSQTHLIQGSNSAQENAVSDGTVNQIHLISGVTSNQPNQCSASSVTQSPTTFVVGSDSVQPDRCSPSSVVQTHLVAGSDSVQSNTCGGSSVVQIHLVTAAPVAVDHVASASKIVQTHLVSCADSAQSNQCSSGSVQLTSAPVARPIGIIRSPSVTLIQPDLLISMTEDHRTITLEN